jgi:transposase
MFTDMDQWNEIRRRVLVEGVSRRQVQRETGLHWKTLTKILGHSEPPGYRQKAPRAKKKLGPYLERIGQILKEDKALPKKQRHTAKRIFERLRAEGYVGGYSVVKEAVRELEQKNREVFVPLAHEPGEAQVDFGQALVKMNGHLRKVAFLVMALPYSDAFFVMAFERECTETFWEGHVRGFEFFGGVPRKIVYDNTRVAVAQIVGGKERRLTHGFLQLQSHHLFAHRFCQVRRPNEKGVVEGTVKFTRLNFFVPVPQVRDLEQLNADLRRRCTEDQERRLRGKEGTKKQRLEEERAAFCRCPPCPLRRAGGNRRRPVRSRWCALTTTTTRCQWPMRITRSWPRDPAARWSCAIWERSWRGIRGFGKKNRSTLSRCTIWRCWNASRVRWIKRDLCRDGSCRRALRCCAAGWKANTAGREPASIFGSCGCWSSIRWRSCAGRWSRP